MATNPSSTVILGGGFTGLFTALHLSHQNYPHPIYLVDEKPQFVFKPLLYELLTGEMQNEQVCPSYEELLQGSEVTFVEGIVKSVDVQQRRVSLESGLHYDYGHLVLALGSTSGYFGIEGAKEHAFDFRTANDAIALTEHLRQRLQDASQCEDDDRRRALLTVAVVGAGPSGVEMAGTLADLLPIWYDRLGGNPGEMAIILMNRGNQILQGDINSHLRQIAEKALHQRTVPVTLKLGASVKAVTPAAVTYETDGETETLPTATTIWTAGTSTHPIIKDLAVSDQHRDRHGRLQVRPTLQLPDYPEVFAGGDCAAEENGALPPTAQVAYQQGYGIARNLNALVQDRSLQPVQVTIKGSLLKLGIRDSAANLFNRFELTGEVGHLIRQGTYLELLPTPVHDFKATAEWLTDELFHRYHKPESEAAGVHAIWQWVAGIAAVALVAGGIVFAWRGMRQQPAPSSALPKDVSTQLYLKEG